MKKIIISLVTLFILNNSVSAQWSNLTSGTNEFLFSITFPTVDTGYTISETGVLRKTTNYGNNWNSLGTFNGGQVLFSDAQTGFIFGSNEILKSSNGGVSWTNKLTINSSRSITGLYFTDANTGYAASGDWTDSLLIFKTIDGGETWNLHSFDLINYGLVYNLFFYNANLGFITNLDGQILRTTDGGLNWTEVYISFGAPVNMIKFTSTTNGYASTDVEFLKTTDGGTNWVVSNPPFSGIFASLDITPNGTIHITGGNGLNAGTLIKSIDDGATWTQTGTSTQSFYGIDFVNDTIGYTSGTNGAIMRYGSVLLNVQENNLDDFSIYPNPSHGLINFANRDFKINEIEVYDQLGRQVFFEKNISHSIDITSFNNGIYFLEIKTDSGIFREKIIKN